MESEEITKRELERWQNVENIEEIPPEALRAMYLDLKENSVSKEEVWDAIHSMQIYHRHIARDDASRNVCRMCIERVFELLGGEKWKQ